MMAAFVKGIMESAYQPEAWRDLFVVSNALRVSRRLEVCERR
jgi:hypothetical protein